MHTSYVLGTACLFLRAFHIYNMPMIPCKKLSSLLKSFRICSLSVNPSYFCRISSVSTGFASLGWAITRSSDCRRTSRTSRTSSSLTSLETVRKHRWTRPPPTATARAPSLLVSRRFPSKYFLWSPQVLKGSIFLYSPLKGKFEYAFSGYVAIGNIPQRPHPFYPQEFADLGWLCCWGATY